MGFSMLQPASPDLEPLNSTCWGVMRKYFSITVLHAGTWCSALTNTVHSSIHLVKLHVHIELIYSSWPERAKRALNKKLTDTSHNSKQSNYNNKSVLCKMKGSILTFNFSWRKIFCSTNCALINLILHCSINSELDISTSPNLLHYWAHNHTNVIEIWQVHPRLYLETFSIKFASFHFFSRAPSRSLYHHHTMCSAANSKPSSFLKEWKTNQKEQKHRSHSFALFFVSSEASQLPDEWLQSRFRCRDWK